MHPFHAGREYARSELLAFVGSKQQQSGVLWGSESPGCLIVTSGGRHGAKAGYSDERLHDGSWWYFGQGSIGDHRLENPANARLACGQHTILLFSTGEPTAAEVRARGNYQKLFAFQGMFNVCSRETMIPRSGPRVGDRLLRFLLAPVAIDTWAVEASTPGELDLAAMRTRLAEQQRPGTPQSGLTVIQYRQRSELVRRYALLRARSRCEGCDSPPPFVDDRGNGFLEVHHIFRLADDGNDEPENVAALCPNCHRRAHYSADRLAFQATLVAKVRALEQEMLAAKGPGTVLQRPRLAPASTFHPAPVATQAN